LCLPPSILQTKTVTTSVDDWGHFLLTLPAGLAGLEEPSGPTGISLQQSQPNPFNPQTTICFDLLVEMPVSLKVYDLSGRLVDIVLEHEMATPGRNEVVWTGRDQSGRQLPSGTYFYRLEAGGFVETKRMTLLK
jgi:hypothetical protein